MEKKLRKYTVRVVIVPPAYEILCGVAQVHEEMREIYGTSKADAMRRAGLA